MRYRKGDELYLKVEDDFGYTDKTYRSVKVQVIGHNVDSRADDREYVVYVPSYEYLKTSFTLSQHHINHFGIDQRFLDDAVAFIDFYHPIYKHLASVPGERCERCKDFFEGVERNDDGKYRCRACQLNPYR
jgi:hypothetical protein